MLLGRLVRIRTRDLSKYGYQPGEVIQVGSFGKARAPLQSASRRPRAPCGKSRQTAGGGARARDSEDRLRLRQEANATSASGRVQSFRRTASLIRRSTIRAACLKANSRTSRSGESGITSQRLIIRQPLPECTAPLRSLARPFPLSNREPLSRASVQWRARSSGCISSEPGISQRSYSPLAGSQHGHAVTKNGVDRTKIALWLGLSPWKALRCTVHADIHIQIQEHGMAKTQPIAISPGRFG